VLFTLLFVYIRFLQTSSLPFEDFSRMLTPITPFIFSRPLRRAHFSQFTSKNSNLYGQMPLFIQLQIVTYRTLFLFFNLVYNQVFSDRLVKHSFGVIAIFSAVAYVSSEKWIFSTNRDNKFLEFFSDTRTLPTYL
jgi:hypothetical protein